MWLRVNSRRLSAPAYLERLDDDGALSHALLPGVDGAVRLARPRPVDELPGFLDGDVSVQDAAAQLAAPWLAVGGARRILDACAAPGGKTGHLLELADRAVSLYAVDSDATRLAAVGENLARLGVSATLIAADASNPEQWWDGQPFDRILLDAPCSASGVIRRHPDIKLLRRPSDIGKLAGLQQQLLQAVWPLLAPGGRLLYVTCSVLARENDRIVAGFMRHTGDARENRVLPNNNIRDLMLAKGCGYQILPGVRGLDGFYFACLDKVS
jgi:16S rRNA (cytosine967-C5)-methyltransferase